jgi:hypothetical protein
MVVQCGGEGNGRAGPMCGTKCLAVCVAELELRWVSSNRVGLEVVLRRSGRKGCVWCRVAAVLKSAVT